MALLNENAQTIQLFAFLLLASSLWENPLGWRFLRQSRGGIFHRLRAALGRSLVLACAWWYETVVNRISADAFDWFYVPIRKRCGHAPAWRVATFFEQRFFPALLGQWLVWPVAKDYLQAKRKAENDEADRLRAYDYWQAKQQADEGRKP